MTPVKFECPGCGQHLECDRACCGDVIHCPRCCAELRIPFPSPKEIPGTVARAEIITHAAAPIPQDREAAEKPIQSVTPPSEKPSATPIDVSCPVCQAELRVKPANSTEINSSPVAEVLRKGQPNPTAANNPTPPSAPRPDVDHMSPEERERHIAAAREARPISLYPSMKPRMDKVLSGDLAPVRPGDGENQKQIRRPPRGSGGGASEKTLSE